MISFLSITLQFFVVVALADFVAGVVHWLEDAYGQEDTPVLGQLVIKPNIIHHHLPRFFTKYSWWQSSWQLVVLGLVTLGSAWALGLLSWHVWVFVLLSINANEIHKMAHRTRAENGAFITALQNLHILQTPRHHALHHSDPKNTYYCPITNFVNPVLESVKFWEQLEAVIERLTGVRHRDDTSVRGQGPAPEWIKPLRIAPAKGVIPRDPVKL